MAGELERALGSIDLSLNSKESKYRELATLQSYDKQREADTLKEQQAEVQFQQYEEQVNKFSESLLENDRKAIRKVHSEGKEYIREQLQMHGGSYKKFMANGGLRVLGNYKSGIISSDEARRYKTNSENMSKIIQARDSNKGHNISSIDMFNLQKYQTEGGGEITYSGLLSDIEKIDQNAFPLGTIIDAEMILGNGNNSAIITGNYMRENPEKGPPNKESLLTYTRKKYVSSGKNPAQLYANKQSKARSNAKNQKDKHLVTETNRLGLKTLNRNADGSAGFRVDDNNAYDKAYQRGRSHNKRIFSEKRFTTASGTEVDSSGNPLTWGNDVAETRPKNAYVSSAFSGSFGTAAKKIYEQYLNPETNRYNIPSSQLYGANGSKLDIDNDITLSLTPKTVITAPTGKGINPMSGNKNEDEFMIVEYSDSKGNVRKKPSDEYIKNVKDNNGDALNIQYRNWKVFEAEDGTLYYEPMDMENISEQVAFSSAIGDQNVIDDEVAAQKTITRKAQAFDARQTVREATNKAANDLVYNDANFSDAVYRNLNVGNQFAENPDIFQTMVISQAMAHDKIQPDDKIGLTATALSRISEKVGKSIPVSSMEALRSGNLTFEDAYVAMRKGLYEEAKNDGNEEEDMQQADMFLDFWKANYESKTNKRVKL
jgi:hypothetical protein